MSAPKATHKRSQPFSEAAIVVFVLLLLLTLWVGYNCLRNASQLNYTALLQHGFFNGFTLPLFIVMPLNWLTLGSGVYFIFKRKIVRANLCLFSGNISLYLVLFCYSPSKTPTPYPAETQNSQSRYNFFAEIGQLTAPKFAIIGR